jgi:hypothetical protein
MFSGQRGEYRFAAGSATGGEPHANSEVKSQWSRTVAAAQVDDIGTIENRDNDGFFWKHIKGVSETGEFRSQIDAREEGVAQIHDMRAQVIRPIIEPAD